MLLDPLAAFLGLDRPCKAPSRVLPYLKVRRVGVDDKAEEQDASFPSRAVGGEYHSVAFTGCTPDSPA